MSIKVENCETYLINKRFGKVVVISFSKYTKLSISGSKYFATKRWWNCLCDCGNHKEILENSLKNGNSNSCGCLHKDYLHSTANNRRLIKEQALNALFCRYQASAKTRKLKFELSKEHFKILTKQNCHYCNSEPNTTYRKWINKKLGDYDEYVYNGVDRFDNSLGYHITNCVSCCKNCNTMKFDMKYDDFIQHISRIYKNKNMA